MKAFASGLVRRDRANLKYLLQHLILMMVEGEIDDVVLLERAAKTEEFTAGKLLPTDLQYQIDAPPPFMIGLSAKKRHGKDSVAVMLNLELTDIDDDGPRIMVVSFANPLKQLAHKSFIWDGKKDVFGRWLLQHLGTEKAHTEKGDDYWIRCAEKYILKVLESRSYPPRLLVVIDVRFPKEVEFVKNWKGGGEVWRIVREAYTDESPKDLNKHASETALDDFNGWDVVIQNSDTGGLNDLHEKVKEQVARLRREGRVLP